MLETLAGIALRHFLTAGGVWMISHGVEAAAWQTISGGIVAAVGVGLSVWNKRSK